MGIFPLHLFLQKKGIGLALGGGAVGVPPVVEHRDGKGKAQIIAQLSKKFFWGKGKKDQGRFLKASFVIHKIAAGMAEKGEKGTGVILDTQGKNFFCGSFHVDFQGKVFP